MAGTSESVVSREQLIHSLYEAAELEHCLLCTYLYAAFSLRDGEAEGMSRSESLAVAGWRRTLFQVALEEMGHLTAVWNITAALGGAPRFGRGNFPLDPGALPARIVVKLAPFSEAVIQHFIHLERPAASNEPEGPGFSPELLFTRGLASPRLTPMALDYDTVGTFYETLGANLRAFVGHHGEAVAFCGDPALQLSSTEMDLTGIKPVICSKTALAAFSSIVEQGEGAPEHSAGSHFQRFVAIRSELAALVAVNPAFVPAFPAAHNPVLRPPLRREGRVWIEDVAAAATVDLANACYALMLRLLAYSYAVPRPQPQKALAIDLALGLMRAMSPLAERAARLPAGPSNPGCHAGVSFTALRDAAALPPGAGAHRFFAERMDEVARAAATLEASGDVRAARASRLIAALAEQARRGFDEKAPDATALVSPASRPVAVPAPAPSPLPGPAPTTSSASLAAAGSGGGASPPLAAPPTPVLVDGVEHIEGAGLTLLYDGKKCIHARFCVTGAPQVFLANVKGPWIRPDAVPVESLAEIAHVCPSGAIRYLRKDGRPDESPPPVNLVAIREGGPYAVRGDLRWLGQSRGGYRATLCRCGASRNKPYCDGSHHEVGFSATGEPPTGKAEMLAVRDGPLEVDPLTDGPLQLRGNLEITSGTGRVVARVEQARLCRCGASENKPFCDGSHARVGFRST